jgi:hypothetical protein
MTDETDDTERGERREHPVLIGVGALVAVSIVVGLIMGGGALAATKVLGVDGDTAGESTSSPTLYLPDPTDTEGDDDPPLSLAPEPEQTTTPFQPQEREEAISLSAGQTEVGPMQQIDLTGTYPGGEGAILQVQQFENGSWNDFPVTASVGGETFATYIQTGQLGENRFRVVDSDTGKKSNEVKVRIG